MKPWPVLVVSLLAASAAMAAEIPLGELAPPGTKVAIGINVRGLVDAPVVKSLGNQAQNLGAKLAATGHLTGFDPLKDLDQILILSTGEGDKAPMLAVLRGRFDLQQLAPGTTRYHDVAMIDVGYAAGPAAGGAMALLDGEIALAGDRAQVQAAIDRRGSGARLNAELASRIDSMRMRYDIWAIGDCPEGLAGPPGAAEALRSVDRFSFGAALRQGAEVVAEVHARLPEDAAKIQVAMGLLESALKAQQPADSAAKFDLHAEDGNFQILLSIPEGELEKAVEMQRKMLVSAVSKGWQPKAMPAPARVVPEPEHVQPQPLRAAKPPIRTYITRGPNGDTTFVRLPGGK
jgi:hypothetical protein